MRLLLLLVCAIMLISCSHFDPCSGMNEHEKKVCEMRLKSDTSWRYNHPKRYIL